MKNFYHICEVLGALEYGVLVPACEVDKELSKMSPEDARIIKRKWRKIMRRASKRIKVFSFMHGEDSSNLHKSKAMMRHHARKILREKGQQILGLKK